MPFDPYKVPVRLAATLMLVRDGVVMTIERAGQATRFDYKHAGHGHHHVVCRGCGTIYDVATEDVPLPAAGLPAGFQVQDVRLEYHGLCAACAVQEKRA